MTVPLVVTLPEDITEQAQTIADLTERPVEQVVIEHLRTLRAPDSALPHELQSELEALQYLSDDALWVIAREQVGAQLQTRINDLLDASRADELTDATRDELAALLDRADNVMLRKAEAAVLLTRRGYELTPDDLRSPHG
jgi:signal transduction histidine kinase